MSFCFIHRQKSSFWSYDLNRQLENRAANPYRLSMRNDQMEMNLFFRQFVKWKQVEQTTVIRVFT